MTTRDRSGWLNVVLNRLMAATSPSFLDDGNVLPDAERPGEDDRQPGDHVAEHALHRERYPGSRDPQARDEREQFHAQVLQRHDPEQDQHQDPREIFEKLADRWLEFELAERALHHPGRPAGGEKAGRHDDDRHEQLGPELHAEVDGRALDLLQCFQVLDHGMSFPLYAARYILAAPRKDFVPIDVEELPQLELADSGRR